MPKLESYSRKLGYSYCLGLYPSLNLIEARPQIARRLLLAQEESQSEGIRRLREKCAALGIREEFAERILKRESKKDNCYAAVVFDKYDDRLAQDAPHAVLCQISDGGNLGTALRSLLGFGIRDVAVIRPCVDRFDPHVMRSSMGAMFRMRLAAFDSFDDYREMHPEHALYPFMLTGAVPIGEAAGAHPPRYSLVFGNEATGLPDEFASYGQSVVIPHSNEIDSLNLSVAVSIGAWAFTQKQQ